MKIVIFALFLVIFSSCQKELQLETRSLVVGLLDESVSLPCQIAGGRSAFGVAVRWTKDQDVVLYTRRGGQEEVGPGFLEKVSVDQSRLDDGDVSLLLSNISALDEGNYTCWVEGITGLMELRIGRLGSRPQLAVDSFRTARSLSLSCVSWGWYPKPIVSWTTSDGQALTGTLEQMEHKGRSGLTDVRSEVTLQAQKGLNVTCSVQSPELHIQSEEMLTITGDFQPSVSPWLLAFWGVFPLVALAGGIIGYFFKRKSDSIKERERQARGADSEPLMNQDEFAELKKEISAARAVSDSEWKRILSKRTKIFSLTPGSVGPEMSSGSHFWEVTLRDCRKWKVGVKRSEITLGLNSFRQAGVWAVSCSPNTGCCASLHPPVPITTTSQLKRLGVLLDCSDGQLTLYDTGTIPVQRLYTFDIVFTSPVVPFYE
ncbi:hypothetical protein GJAV_G00183590 [Gymnothorax javanicus]|nr:hypothetical protein GJAV_G00183590 [Gymnothorax javanicus]